MSSASTATLSRRPAVPTLLRDYLTLTKPKVQSLLLFTTITTMYVAGHPSAELVFLTCLGGVVIGGAAGAVPPLVAWAAVTGGLDGMAFYLFAIVFFWTPPHFWALSLLMKDEYAKAGIPMLPVVRGEEETRRQILLYTVLLYAVTQLPFCAGGLGVAYLVPSMLLGAGFIYFSTRLYRSRDRRWALKTYLYSLAYLALLFLAMAVAANV